MAVIQVESVAITKSRLAKGFNGDNLNLNGKVISSQEADAGFKAAGNVKPPYVAVIASGNQKGFAAGAAAAFNDYVKDININKYNAEAVINRFFDDMDSVVEKCSIDGARLSIGIVCAYDDCVVAAKSGNCHLLRFSEGELFEIALSDDGERGFQFVDVIADGDVFALIGEESSADLDYDGIVNVFDQGNELKLAVRDIFKLLSASARGKDCSVILMKLGCDSERTYAVLPVAENPDDDFDSALSESPEDFVVPDDYIADANDNQTAKKSSKKKFLGLIPVVILVILLAVAAALYFATRPAKNEEEGTSSPDVIVVAPDEEDSTGDFNGSNGMQTVEDNGPGGDAGEIEDENAQETTTKAPETTTKRPSTTYPSTSRPSTTQPSTSAPETTTAQSDETTTAQSAETTTAQSDEITTAQSAETTTAPATEATTAPATEATTLAPAETPDEPAVETPAEPVNEEPVAPVNEEPALAE